MSKQNCLKFPDEPPTSGLPTFSSSVDQLDRLPLDSPITTPHMNEDLDDLIHIDGPLTEDAVIRIMYRRFLNQKYFVSISPSSSSMSIKISNFSRQTSVPFYLH